MSAFLTSLIIQAATDHDSVILDPMAGSGTVLAAARALGRSCYAFDIDPLALIMMRVIGTQQDVGQIKRAGERVLEDAIKLSRDLNRLDQLFAKHFDKETQEFIHFWFPTRSRRGLLALWWAIKRVGVRKVRNVLALAFSRLIIAKSAGVSRAIDLPHTRPHRRLDKEVPDPLVMFPRRLKEVLQRLSHSTPNPVAAPLVIQAADARRLPLDNSSIDLVLTSSPYANAIDYVRAHKFSLVWMGYSLSTLRTLRAQMIGAERSESKVRQELAWLEHHLPKPDGRQARRRAILRRYFYDMDRVLGELYRVLKPGGACILILGRSTVGNHIVDTPALVVRLAEKYGFEHINTRYRQINPLRRSLPFAGSRGLVSPLGRRIAQEAIVGLGRG